MVEGKAQVSDHSLLTCILQGRRPCNVHFLDAEENELEESTGTNAVNLPATSDIVDSLSAVGQQSSVSDTSLIPSERIISLPADLEVFLLERWRFLFSLFESKPVYSSSDDLAKQWSGDIVLSPELGLESDFKNKLDDNEASENVNYVLAIEPCGVVSLVLLLMFLCFLLLLRIMILFIKQRQAEGIVAAKTRGVRFGRPKIPILVKREILLLSWLAFLTTP